MICATDVICTNFHIFVSYFHDVFSRDYLDITDKGILEEWRYKPTNF